MAARAAFIESLELGPDKKIGFLVQSSVYALTDRQLCIATRGDFRERPRELLHAGPRERPTVYWYDGRVEAGNQFRRPAFVFADGTWPGDRTGIKVPGRVPKASDTSHFTAALGPAAVEPLHGL